MVIRDMFKKDITRRINGVVKVAQDDDADLRQELEEYVLTRELRTHLADFLSVYARAFDEPTDRIGVWISGFFGSGKSHFLKMLSYLLANRVVAGVPALDYFRPKLEGDAELSAMLERCCAVPCESILFNIEGKSKKKDEQAVLRVFYSVFYESLGFSRDIKLARLEKEIDDAGATEAFRQAWERIEGKPWVSSRKTYQMKVRKLAEALSVVPGLAMGADDVRAWLKSEDDITVDRFTDEIRDYVNRRIEQKGSDFRLLFCADEMGQYIDDDTGRMLNLQEIVEQLGAKCAGHVWVLVTSQEAVDQVSDKFAGRDFSKIQGRFDTRLSLSSSSVDEVIAKRLLDKTDVATATLAAEYAVQENALKNLFTFSQGTTVVRAGYADAGDFASVYPFVPYQFDLLQAVYEGVRRHGSVGKHMSEGERSMLSGFQEVAQELMERPDSALAPFWRFYDTLHTFLEGYIHRVVTSCEEAAAAGDAGLEPEDVPVLKLLFLLKYVGKQMPANLDNLTILMAEQVDPDLAALRARVQGSLDRLYRRNCIDKMGDTYIFLTDEEQDIAREISEIPVESADVLKQIADIMFGDLYPATKVAHGENVFPLACYVDETLKRGRAGDLPLRVVTDAYPVERRDAGSITLRSSDGGGECIALLPEYAGYYENVCQAVKIERYALTRDKANFTDTQNAILSSKQAERRNLLKRAGEQLADALAHARFFVAGGEVTVRAGGAKTRLDAALEELVGRRYTKLAYIGVSYTEAELEGILSRGDAIDGSVPNQRAVDAVGSWLEDNAKLGREMSALDVRRAFAAAPFGWRVQDIAACVLELVRARRVELVRAGMPLDARDAKRMVSSVLQRGEAERVQVRPRVATDERVLKLVRDVYKDVTGVNTVPVDEDELAERLADALASRRAALKERLEHAYAVQPAYPGRSEVERAAEVTGGLLAERSNRTGFLGAVARAEDDLLDALEAVEPVEHFWGAQQKVFDGALELRQRLGGDMDAVTNADAEAATAWARIEEIVANERPYRLISELPPLVQTVRRVHAAQLERARNDAAARVRELFDELGRDAEEKGVAQRFSARFARECDFQLKGLDTCSLMGDVVVRLKRLYEIESDDYRDIKRESDRMRERVRATKDAVRRVTAATDGDDCSASAARKGAASPAADAAPEPREDTVRVSRASVAPLRYLTSEEDVDAYAQRLARHLKRELAGHDSIQLID